MMAKSSALGRKNPLGIRLITYWYLLNAVLFTIAIVLGILFVTLGAPVTIYNFLYWGSASVIGYLIVYGLMGNKTWGWWLAVIASTAVISL